MRVLGVKVDGSSRLSPFVDGQAKSANLASERQWWTGIFDRLNDASFFFFCIVTIGLESFFREQLEASSVSWEDGNLQQDS